MIDQIQFSFSPEKETKDWGRYLISPLPRGFGQTLGHSLRRVLLGALPGAAVTQIKVQGAAHLFTTLKGVKEDLVEIMLNVKQIRFSYQGDKEVILKLEKKGGGAVKAGDIKVQPGVEIVNPDLVLAHLTDKGAKLKMDLTLSRGVGYQAAEEHKSSRLGVIGIGSIFTPVLKVNYRVETITKGKGVDLDKLIIEIWTDGSTKPKKAIEAGAKILIEAFNLILKPKADKKKKEEKEENHDLDLLVEEIDEIPLRLVNALRKAGFKTVKDLIEAGMAKAAKAKNVGGKSIDLLRKSLKKRNIDFN